MPADYSKFNPALDKRVIELLPYDGHLYAFMRLVLFHPDYSPHISFDEQYPLCKQIVDEYSRSILTVGAIIYHVAQFVEKRHPLPPRQTSSVTVMGSPRKIALDKSGIFGLCDEEPEPENKPSESQEKVEISIGAIDMLSDFFEPDSPKVEEIKKSANFSLGGLFKKK